VQITVAPNPGYTGFVLITVHCEFGWLKEKGWTREGDDAKKTDKEILPSTPYTFRVGGQVISSWAIENWNDF
jgi:hypothetical protein